MAQKTIHVMGKLAAFVAILSVAFYLASLAHENETIRTTIASFGYVGLLALSFLSGFNLAVPVPAVAFLPLFLQSGLSFWPSILLIAVGTSLADVVAYFIGRAGRHVVHHFAHDGLVARIERVRHRYPTLPIILLLCFVSFIPLPNEIVVVPLGFLGYRMRRLLPIVFVGNITFNLLYAAGIMALFQTISF